MGWLNVAGDIAQELEQFTDLQRDLEVEGYAQAVAIITDHRDVLDRFAKALIQFETLDGEEDLVDLRQADRAHQLPLRSLAAVEEQLVAAAANEQRWHAAAGGGHRAAGAGEEDVEVHGRARLEAVTAA